MIAVGAVILVFYIKNAHRLRHAHISPLTCLSGRYSSMPWIKTGGIVHCFTARVRYLSDTGDLIELTFPQRLDIEDFKVVRTRGAFNAMALFFRII